MKIVLIGGIGTAIVVADQILDAKTRYGVDIEVLGLSFSKVCNEDQVSRRLG